MPTWATNKRVAEWLMAIRQAVAKAGGVAPGSLSNQFVNEPSGATPDGARGLRALTETRSYGKWAFGLFLVGTLGSLLLMTLFPRQEEPAVAFGGLALVLSLVLGLLSWRERLGKFAVIATGTVFVALIVIGFVSALVIAPAKRAEMHARMERERQNFIEQMNSRLGRFTFGPVIERTINSAVARTNFLIRFKTGELYTQPSETTNSPSAILGWARNQGIDAGVGIINFTSNVLSGFDMVALSVPAQCWDELTPAQATKRLDSQPLDTFRIMFYGTANLHDTCVFRTREGGVGILQLTQYVSDPPGLKVRYKYLDQRPDVTQMDSHAGPAESWTPELWPGEKPDPSKVLSEARELSVKTRYAEALQRHIWYHNHALEYDPGHSGVRLSFALSDWIDLGRQYPKAKQALIEIRDTKTRALAEGRGDAGLFNDVSSINGYLQNNGATVKLFKEIEQRNPALANQCYLYVESLLVEQGEYELCLKHIGDPQAKFDLFRRGWEMQKQTQRYLPTRPIQLPPGATPPRSIAQSADTNLPARSVRLPPGVPSPPDMSQLADNHFIKQVRTLIEILVGVDRKAEAEKICDQALALVNVPQLQSAVSDAEKKVGERRSAALTFGPVS